LTGSPIPLLIASSFFKVLCVPLIALVASLPKSIPPFITNPAASNKPPTAAVSIAFFNTFKASESSGLIANLSNG